jgi:hypothetical protein
VSGVSELLPSNISSISSSFIMDSPTFLKCDELRVIILFCPSVAVIILPFFSLIFSGVGLNGVVNLSFFYCFTRTLSPTLKCDGLTQCLFSKCVFIVSFLPLSFFRIILWVGDLNVKSGSFVLIFLPNRISVGDISLVAWGVAR